MESVEVKFGSIVEYKEDEWDDSETYVGLVIHEDLPDLMIANEQGNRLYSIPVNQVVKTLGYINIEKRIKRAEKNLSVQAI